MKKKIIADVFLNIFASFLPMFTLQLVILPLIAKEMDSNSYGQLLSIVALINLLGGTAGNVLNNLRLINHKKYSESKIIGDYNILLLVLIMISVVIIYLGIKLIDGSMGLLSITMIVISTILLIIKGYARVEFRIKLNFRNILSESVILLCGYLFGLLLFIIFEYWEAVYLFGFLFSVIWIYKNTELLKEPIVKTEIFNKTGKQLITLYLSGLLLSLGIYVDKLLLYPLLGGAAVSVYYTSTILGKSISMVIQPITSVMLSYFAHLKEFEAKKFRILIVLVSVIGVVGYIMIILVSKPILNIIYPKYVDEAMKYININTLSIIIIIMTNIINSVLLKFCEIKWQVIINAVYMIVYVFASLVLMKYYNLMGFCIGILVASIIKLLVMIFAYYQNYKLENIQDSRIELKASHLKGPRGM